MNQTRNDQPVIEARELVKIYTLGRDVQVPALRGVSFRIYPGEAVAIMGPSGSGKSTLMHILGCLDKPTSGEYYLDGQKVSEMNDDQLAYVRNRKIGFVFQAFNLLPRLTALENVALPLRYAGQWRGIHRRAREMLERVGLGERLHHRPNELSGGQQQRVAIARALVNNPAIILADEPTGNLDTKTGQEILDLLLQLNREQGVTLVVVTHDPEVAQRMSRILLLRDGLLVGEQAGQR